MAQSQAKKTKAKTVKSHTAKKGTSKAIAARKPAFGKTSSKKGAAKKAVKTAKKSVVTKKPLKLGVKGTPKPTRAKRPAGMSEQVLNAALKVLDERQAEEIFTVDLSGKSSMADYLIIASGRASRQLSAIAHYLREAFENLGLRNIRVEGLADANWVLVDAGDVIVHLFRPEVRNYYNLESMWSEKSVASTADDES